METGIYLRVSTEEQAQEGFSIRGQEQKLKDYANIKDWSIYKIYADEGISGKNITERPAMNELIKDIKAGKVKNVLVFKIDRLTRNTADLLFLVELFNEYGCAFNSLMESIDTQTPSGRMFLKIIGIFAEFERENIIERVKLGLERKVKEGYSIANSSITYGYDRPKGQKIQTINEAEAEIVREIYDMYVKQGLSLAGIAKILNIRGIKTKGNSVWAGGTIRAILTNCTYVGKVRHHTDDKTQTYECNGLHDPIISPELFEEAQKVIERNGRASPTKQPKEHAYFSGLLFCSECGTKYEAHYPKQSVTSISYSCRRKNMASCNASGMSHRKLEQAFQEYIDRIEIFSEADRLELQRQEQLREQNQQLAQQYKEKQRQLDRKEKEILELYVNNDIDFDGYRNMKKKIDGDRETIQAELAKLDMQEEQEPEEIKREDIITELKRNWKSLTNTEKRQFLVRFVKQIVAVNEKQAGEHFGTVKVLNVKFHCN